MILISLGGQLRAAKSDGNNAVCKNYRYLKIAAGVGGAGLGTFALAPYLVDYRLSAEEKEAANSLEPLATKIGKDLKTSFKQRGVSAFSKYLHERFNANEEFQQSFPEEGRKVLIPVAFIDPQLKVEGENIYGAYLRMAEEHDLKWQQLRKNPQGEKFEYDFTTKSADEIVSLSKAHLEKVKVPSISKYEDKNVSIDVYKFGGTDDKDELKAQAYFNKMCHLATPLFLEIIKHPNASIRQEQFYDMALKIYSDPLTAFGMISFVTLFDAQHINRKRASLIAAKLKPLFPEQNDPAGQLYHFWNYASRAVFSGGSAVDNYRSWGFETAYQRDRDDRISDKIGMDFGAKINSELNNPGASK